MWKILAALLLLPLTVSAIEYEFDGGQITALGGVTSQPAGLGYLDSKYSFSASATSLEYSKYYFNGVSYEQNTSPFGMKPVYAGGAMSTSYGGWSFLIFNSDRDIKGHSLQTVAGTTTDSDLSTNVKAFSILVSSGFRIHENWSLGWGLGLNQVQLESKSESSQINGGSGTLTTASGLSQGTTANFSMGTLLSLEQFVWGVKVSLPQTMITSSSNLRSRTLNGNTNTYTDTTTSQEIVLPKDWLIESGVRLGRTGFAYVLSDAYQTSGQHTWNFGFEYVAGWGSLASGYLYSDFQGARNTKLTVGFIKDHKNFKWGIGPYYKTESNSQVGAIDTKSLGVLYSSEIRY